MAITTIDLGSTGEGVACTVKAGGGSIQWKYSAWFAVVITKDSSSKESTELLGTTSRPSASGTSGIYSTNVYAIKNKHGHPESFHAHYYYVREDVPPSPLEADDHGEDHHDIESGPPSNTVIVSTP